MTEPDFREKKMMGMKLGKKGLKWAQNEDFWDFLEKSEKFANVACSNRKRYNLANVSGQTTEKKCLVSFLAIT